LTLLSTSGQNVLDAAPQVGTFQLFSGFWVPQLAPTATSTTISGRVQHADGRGLPNASVIVTDGFGSPRAVHANPFGYFRFGNIQLGRTYIFEVYAKGYSFAPQVVNVQEDVKSLIFLPLENQSR